MKHVTLPLALFTIRLAHLITAQCPACDSYSAALRSCQKTSTNITAIGNTMDTSSVHCMCVSSSSATQMNTCQGCGDTNIDARILGSWYNTCKADGQYGDQQAIACWEAQPGSFLPCVSNTVGKGSGTTTGGFGVTTPSEATSPSATVSPSTKAVSGAVSSCKALGMSAIMTVALGVVIGA